MEWTEERIETLSRLWREGHSASQVARRLGGVTRNAVIGKAHRLGLSIRDAPSRPNLPGAPAVVRAPPAVRPIPARPCEARHDLSSLRPHPAFELSPTATLMSLEDDGCRWPIGDPDRPGFGFCGRIRARGGAYCAEHAPLSTERGRSRSVNARA